MATQTITPNAPLTNQLQIRVVSEKLYVDSRPPARGIAAPANNRSIHLAGKVGELLQGVQGGKPFEVPLNVTSGPMFTRAQFLAGRPLDVVSHTRMCATKTLKFLNGLADAFSVCNGDCGAVQLDTNVPIGKGAASSSCDMTVAGLCLLHGIGIAPNLPDFYRQLCSIERSDPVFLPSELIVAGQADGWFYAVGPIPRFILVAWDSQPMREVDTASVAVVDNLRSAHEGEYAELLSYALSLNAEVLKHVATQSSTINQHYLPKPEFDWVVGVAADLHAGVVAAHSGTYLGLLLDHDISPTDVGIVRRAIGEKGYEPQIFMVGS